MAQQLNFFQSRLISAAIATLSLITATPSYSATPNPNPSAALGEPVTPLCPPDQPFPFATEKCPTGGQDDRQERMQEAQQQINDHFQTLRRSLESETIRLEILRITF
jgi:hypothetical protein